MVRRNAPKNGNYQVNPLLEPPKEPKEPKEYWWNARASTVKEQGNDQITNPITGRPPKFRSPEALWFACTEYFKWTEENPLQEYKVFLYKGLIIHENLAKMRAMTIQGLCIFLGSRPDTWLYLKTNRGEEFSIVCLIAEAVIYNQKFTGAAASLLKESIIARDLGLKEQHEFTGPGGGPIQVQAVPVDMSKLSNKELDIVISLAEKIKGDTPLLPQATPQPLRRVA